jgi:hypothetical protein
MDAEGAVLRRFFSAERATVGARGSAREPIPGGVSSSSSGSPCEEPSSGRTACAGLGPTAIQAAIQMATAMALA